VVVKETVAPAWICLPDQYRPARDGIVDPQSSRHVPVSRPQGVIARVADRLGINRETLRNRVKQAETDDGPSTADAQRIAQLEQENRELRRANDILKAAASFFARELDPRLPK
jgi:transposase